MSLANKTVIKHSSAIQISNTINLLQRQAWNVLLANAYDNLEKTDKYQISIRELAEFLKYDSNNIEHLKESLRVLNTTQVEWNVLHKDNKKEWGVFTLLSSARIINGVCYYAYDPFLREQLHNPRIYAKINLSLQNKFHSKHSLSIYELSFDFHKVGETPWYSIEEFRVLLGLENNEYLLFRDLNKHVLKKAQKEINKISGLLIDYEFKRKSRKIIAIKINIKPNKENVIDIKELKPKSKKETQLSLPFPGSDIDNQELYNILINEFGISNGKASEILKRYDEFYIQEILKVVRKQIEGGNIKNIAPFTVTAIKNDYRHKKPAHELKKETTVKKKQLKEKKENLLKDLQKELNNETRIEVKKIIAQLSTIEKEKIEKKWLNTLEKKEYEYNQYLKRGMKSGAVQMNYNLYFTEFFLKNKKLDKKYSDIKLFAKSKGYTI